jgi:hypothetical protein
MVRKITRNLYLLKIKIIELAEANKDKCKNYKFDWRSYYNGFLDGFATYFNKHRNCR